MFRRTVGTLFSLHSCNSYVTNAFQPGIFNEFTSVRLDSEKRLFSRKDAERGKMMRKEEKEGNERGKRYTCIQDI